VTGFPDNGGPVEIVFPMGTPITAVCIQIGESKDTEAYSSAFQGTFREAEIANFGSVGAVPLLEVTEVRHFHVSTRVAGSELLAGDGFARLKTSCERLFVVVIDAMPLVAAEPLPVLTMTRAEDSGPTYIKTVTLFLTPQGLFRESSSEDGTVSTVVIGLDDLDERDLQIPFFVLHLLRTATALLTARASPSARPYLFFSHAKRDGVSLARGARMWLQRLPGFDGFYDTDDLDLAGNWRTQLSMAVADSILIVFRTEAFDQRYWCRQEVLWADEHHRPLICVDARWQLQHESSLIGFDSSPAVRVPDGSIFRILLAALREAFRVALFEQRVALSSHSGKFEVKAIPRAPSLVNLASARRELESHLSAGPMDQKFVQYIVYPNPAVPEEVRKALVALIEIDSDDPKLRVRAFDEWRAEVILSP
jgi:hypothetical protein